MKKAHFQVLAIDVPAPYRLRITYGDGAVLDVDLAQTISRTPALAALADVTLFAEAEIDEWGLGVSWLQGEVGLAGDKLRGGKPKGKRPLNLWYATKGSKTGMKGIRGITAKA